MSRNLLAVFVLFIDRKTGGNTKVWRGVNDIVIFCYIPAASLITSIFRWSICGGEIAVCIE